MADKRIVAAALGLLSACSADPGTGNGDAGRGDSAFDAGHSDGANTGDGTGAGDGASHGDGANTGDDGTCGSTAFQVHPTPPNILVLLDRSCSMRRDVNDVLQPDATSTTSKWAIATRVLGGLTGTYASQVRWGLLYFPRVGGDADGVSCTASPVCGGDTPCPEVAPQPSGGPMVMSALRGLDVSPFDLCGTTGPMGDAQAHITPIGAALTAAGAVSQLHNAARPEYVLLVTDGEESCMGSDVSMVSMQLADQVHALLGQQIRTAVVGFGSEGGADGVNPTELDAMGAAGGVPASGAHHYYSADDEASLQAALSGIVAEAISCTFPFTGAPPTNPDLLHVYVNGSPTELTRDASHMGGWDYDSAAHAITLYGSACDDAQHLRLMQLNVVEWCPGAPPPPPPGACHHASGSCDSDADCCNLEGLSCQTSSHTCIVTPG